MRQPCLDDEGYEVLCARQTVSTQAEAPHFVWSKAWPAIGFLVVALLGYGVFYVWAHRHGKYRVSDVTKIGSAALGWLAGALAAGLALLWWHLVRGGPL